MTKLYLIVGTLTPPDSNSNEEYLQTALPYLSPEVSPVQNDVYARHLEEEDCMTGRAAKLASLGYVCFQLKERARYR